MERTRFEKELEFVQSLCNPEYMKFLYQENYFKDDKFINFLKYLNYWQEKQYRKFLIYPQCLEILNLCQNEQFIKSLSDENTYLLLSEQMYNIWNNQNNKK